MSILQYPDAMNAPELQVWNNAAFDNDEPEGRWSSCLEPDPVFVNRSTDSVRSDFSGKENLSPSRFAKTPVSISAKPLGAKAAILNSQSKPPKLLFKEEEKRIDSEIEEIERQISRLSSRLEALRIEKAERNAAKTVEKRGRIVPAKFLEPPARQGLKNSSEEGFPPASCGGGGAKSKGLNRRGMSLGPSEIVAGAGLRRLSKLEITPVQAAQNRRKSCFWKLQEIDELRATKERGKSASLSPKSRKAASKTQPPPKQPATTACSNRRAARREEAILAAIQPKKLFRDSEKSTTTTTTAKKAARPGRVVASRYNSAAANDGRKRSLPEEEKEDEAKRREKKRMSLAGKPGRGKKKWEIPSEVVVFRGSAAAEEEEENSPPSAAAAEEEEEIRGGEVLPRIRTLRWAEKSPRDSGPAKRVAELVGRRSVFGSGEEANGEVSVCQVLSFGEEEVEN